MLFFFNDTAPTEIYPLPLHDPLPISTLSVDDTASIVAALRVRFPGLKAPEKEDICYATQNRQDAVKDLIGDRKSTRLNSSHSQISYAVFCLTKQDLSHSEHPCSPTP